MRNNTLHHLSVLIWMLWTSLWGSLNVTQGLSYIGFAMWLFGFAGGFYITMINAFAAAREKCMHTLVMNALWSAMGWITTFTLLILFLV